MSAVSSSATVTSRGASTVTPSAYAVIARSDSGEKSSSISEPKSETSSTSSIWLSTVSSMSVTPPAFSEGSRSRLGSSSTFSKVMVWPS